jgi:hypothetical protein
MVNNAAPSSDTDTHGAPQLPLTYYASKRKALLCLLGSVGFVAIGCWLITIPDTSPLQKTISAAVTILFGLAAALVLYLLIWNPWIVKLDRRGILIRSSKRWIAWSEIADIDLMYQDVPGSSQEIEYIGILLKDISAYYASLGSRGRRLAVRTEQKLGTPILINCGLLPIEPETLIAWLNQYRTEYSR